MTKKPSIKNREWEKERRDRLNAALDKLGQLLPQDGSNLSKFEIVQRAIQIVEELQLHIRDLLAGSNASILKSQQELEQAMKIMLERNQCLGALLKKAKITAPAFQAPIFIGFTEPQPAATNSSPLPELAENNCNNLNVMLPVGRPPKHSQLVGTASSLVAATVTIGTQTRAIPPATVYRLPILQSSGPLVLLRPASGSDGSARIVPQRSVRRKLLTTAAATVSNSSSVGAKVAIPALKRRNVRYKVRHRRNRQPKAKPVPTDVPKSDDLKAAIGESKRAADEPSFSSEPSACKRPRISDDSAKPPEQVSHTVAQPSDTSVSENLDFDPSYPQTAAFARPVHLSQDILDDLQQPPAAGRSDSGSMSPTAAFLLSFPVVATGSCDRRNAGDHHEQQQQQQPEQQPEQHQHNSILENITTLLTTKDYERFVEDVAKTEHNMSRKLDEKPVAAATDCAFDAANKTSYEVERFEKSPEKCNAKSKENAGNEHSTPETSQPSTYSTRNDVFAANYAPPDPPRFSATATTTTTTTTFTFSLTTSSTSPATTTTAASAKPDLGFYDTLSSIGSVTIAEANRSANQRRSTRSNSNLYSNALSLASSASASSNYAPHSSSTAFTFSLSQPTQSQSVQAADSLRPGHTVAYDPLPVSYKSSAQPRGVAQQFAPHFVEPHATLSTTASYNPFAFDNIPGLPVQPQTAAGVADPVAHFTFSLTSSSQAPPVSAYTGYNYYTDPPATGSAGATHPNGPAEPNESTPARSALPFSVCAAVTPKPTHPDPSPSLPASAKQSTGSKSHVNWMTSASTPSAAAQMRHSAAPIATAAASSAYQEYHPTAHDYLHQHHHHHHHHNHSQPPAVPYYPGGTSNVSAPDSYHPVARLPAPPMPAAPAPAGNDVDQFGVSAAASAAAAAAASSSSSAWSPNKMLAATHATHTLPTLHGDLALNTEYGAVCAAYTSSANSIVRPHLSAIASTRTTAAAAAKPSAGSKSFLVSDLVESAPKPAAESGCKMQPPESGGISNKHLRSIAQCPKDGKTQQQQPLPNHHYPYQYGALPTSASSAAPKSSTSNNQLSNNYSAEALLSGSTSSTTPKTTAPSQFRSSARDCQQQLPVPADCYQPPSSSVSADIYQPHPAPVGGGASAADAYNYYAPSYASGGAEPGHYQTTGGSAATAAGHNESDYLGAGSAHSTNHSTAALLGNSRSSSDKVATVARAASFYAPHAPNQQHQQQQQQQHQQSTISHAYPFNNNSSSLAAANSRQTVATQYSNNYRCVADIVAQPVSHSFFSPPAAAASAAAASVIPNGGYQYQQPPQHQPQTFDPHAASLSRQPHYPDAQSSQSAANNGYDYSQTHHNHQQHPHQLPNQQQSQAVGNHHYNNGCHSATTGHSGSGSGGGGSGLVSNFNLSTICPEINQDNSKSSASTSNWGSN